MAVAGGAVAVARRDLLTDLEPLVASRYRELAGGRARRRVGGARVPDGLGRDTGGGVGPTPRGRHPPSGVHVRTPRDDVAMLLSGRDARIQASQGEQRSVALSLRLAIHEVGDRPDRCRADSPVDDVFSELDLARAGALVQLLPSGQCLLTTATEPPPGVRVARTVDVASLVGATPATRTVTSNGGRRRRRTGIDHGPRPLAKSLDEVMGTMASRQRPRDADPADPTTGVGSWTALFRRVGRRGRTGARPPCDALAGRGRRAGRRGGPAAMGYPGPGAGAGHPRQGGRADRDRALATRCGLSARIPLANRGHGAVLPFVFVQPHLRRDRSGSVLLGGAARVDWIVRTWRHSGCPRTQRRAHTGTIGFKERARGHCEEVQHGRVTARPIARGHHRAGGPRTGRRRPGMYIGSTGPTGLHHLIWEVATTPSMKRMAGYWHPNRRGHAHGRGCRVQDDGRGIPVDSIRHSPPLAAEIVLTTLHAGGSSAGLATRSPAAFMASGCRW